jgi:hypothetical protein
MVTRRNEAGALGVGSDLLNAPDPSGATPCARDAEPDGGRRGFASDVREGSLHRA